MKKARVSVTKSASKSASKPAKTVEVEEEAVVLAPSKTPKKTEAKTPSKSTAKTPKTPKTAAKEAKEPVVEKEEEEQKPVATKTPKKTEEKPSKKRTAAAAVETPAPVVIKTPINLSEKPTDAVLARAVEALIHHVKEHRKANEGKTAAPLPGVSKEECAVFLQIGIRSIPEASLKTFKGRPVRLPHSFRPARTAENVCMFVKDKAEARKLLGEDYSNKFGIKKIIDLSQLRTQYKTFQSKRQLAAEYDCFFADDRIVCMLPKTLGKGFYMGANKRPLPIRFAVVDTHKTLKKKVDTALQSTYLYLSGASTVLKIGDVDMDEKLLRENLSACIVGAVEHIPLKWKGVQALFIKSERSASLPIYQALSE
ncbi:hypothetical protein BASA81_006625 [Batrachochytrium salamandrivorans]|nr:hypothetical protein BASA81_006625 [Batrachochytrium salamandrivorans]